MLILFTPSNHRNSLDLLKVIFYFVYLGKPTFSKHLKQIQCSNYRFRMILEDSVLVSVARCRQETGPSSGHVGVRLAWSQR